MNGDGAGRLRLEAYAIVSSDGMLADATGVMPESLKFAADQRYFESGLDRVDVVVHGRHSREQQTPHGRRRRLILTRRVRTAAPHASDPDAFLWNPAGASLETALGLFDRPLHRVAVIGGSAAFEQFLDRYDCFHLTRASGVHLPGGRPVFSTVPRQTPEAVLAQHGLVAGPVMVLDAARGVTSVNWSRRITP